MATSNPTADPVTFTGDRMLHRTLLAAGADAAALLCADCHAHASAIRKGDEVLPVVYLYWMKADAALDANLLQMLGHKGGDLPKHLIGTVAKVSELRRHICNLRAMTRYRRAVIAIRIWSPDATEPLSWDEPLVLSEGLGPIAILTHGPVVESHKGTKGPAFSIHSGSRLGKQLFCKTDSAASANVFISPNVTFPITEKEMKLACLASVVPPGIWSVCGFVGDTWICFQPCNLGFLGMIVGILSLLLGCFVTMCAGWTIGQKWLRGKKNYVAAGEQVFMREDVFIKSQAAQPKIVKTEVV